MSTDQAVVIWGELLWDLFPDGPQLGGAPANVAWHLGLAGGWAQLITRVGDDERGRAAIAALEPLVDTSMIQVDPARGTGVVEVRIGPAAPAEPGQLHLGAGEPRYTLVPDRAWEHIECTPHARAALADAGVMVFGSLSQRRAEGLAAWREAVASAREGCIKACDINLRRTAVDASERRAVDEALAAADLLKVNDRELAVLADWHGWKDPIAELRRPGRVLAVTHGAAGATLFGSSGAAIEVAGVRAAPGGDNVGCGDAFLAILVHGMTLGWDLERSGRAAARWAAAVAEVRGATPRFDDERAADLLELES